MNPSSAIPTQATPLRIGLFGVGLDTYWGQFPGLRERLEGYLGQINTRLSGFGADVVSAGLVDSVEKAQCAAGLFAAENVRIVFLYVSTYALSSTILPAVRTAHVPIIVLNLQPESRIDYERFNDLRDRGTMTGEWLAFCQACAIPEVASVFHRSGIPFHQITGTLTDASAWLEIGEWVEAARVAETMQTTRLGIIGHYYDGMLDVYSDPTMQTSVFGTHVEHLEIDLLRHHRGKVTHADLQAKIGEIHQTFAVSAECLPEEIERAARTACALDRLVAEKSLGAIAYYYEGNPGSEEEDIISSIIVGNSLLTARHVPVAGECEVKNAQAMKIMDAFGAGGSFSEFYAMDFDDDVVLLGHDGPGHIGIGEGKPVLKPLGVYHGKPGHGLSVEMRVRNGPVTLLAVVQTRDGKLKLLTAEGASVPGPILEIGNTNSRYRFALGVKGFVDAWCKESPAHHCAIGLGHVASRLRKFAAITGMDFVQVC
jgi:L-arabinose isomerase